MSEGELALQRFLGRGSLQDPDPYSNAIIKPDTTSGLRPVDTTSRPTYVEPQGKPEIDTIGEIFDYGIAAGTAGLRADRARSRAGFNVLFGMDPSDNLSKAEFYEIQQNAVSKELPKFRKNLIDEPSFDGFLQSAASATGQIIPSAIDSMSLMLTGGLFGLGLKGGVVGANKIAASGILGSQLSQKGSKEVASKLIKDSLTRKQLKISTPAEDALADNTYKFVRNGALTGMFVSEFEPLTGSNIKEGLQSGRDLDSDLVLRSSALGSMQAAIGVGGEAFMAKLLLNVAKERLKKSAKENLKDSLLSSFAKNTGETLKRIGAAGLKSATIEGAAETAQESLAVLNRADMDANFQFRSEEAALRIAEAAFSGFIGGGAIGTSVGTVVETAAGISDIANEKVVYQNEDGSYEEMTRAQAAYRNMKRGVAENKNIQVFGKAATDATSGVIYEAEQMVNKARQMRIDRQVDSEVSGRPVDASPFYSDPEPQSVITAQLDAVVDPSSTKDTVWREGPPVKAEKVLLAPRFSKISYKGVPMLASHIPGRGTIYTTNRQSLNDVLEKDADEYSLARALGYSDVKRGGESVVQVKDKQGRVVSEQGVDSSSPNVLNQAMEAAEKLKPEGGSIAVRPVSEVLAERANLVKDEEGPVFKEMNVAPEDVGPTVAPDLETDQDADPNVDIEQEGTPQTQEKQDLSEFDANDFAQLPAPVSQLFKAKDAGVIYDNTNEARARFQAVLGQQFEQDGNPIDFSKPFFERLNTAILNAASTAKEADPTLDVKITTGGVLSDNQRLTITPTEETAFERGPDDPTTFIKDRETGQQRAVTVAEAVDIAIRDAKGSKQEFRNIFLVKEGEKMPSKPNASLVALTRGGGNINQAQVRGVKEAEEDAAYAGNQQVKAKRNLQAILGELIAQGYDVLIPAVDNKGSPVSISLLLQEAPSAEALPGTTAPAKRNYGGLTIVERETIERQIAVMKRAEVAVKTGQIKPAQFLKLKQTFENNMKQIQQRFDLTTPQRTTTKPTGRIDQLIGKSVELKKYNAEAGKFGFTTLHNQRVKLRKAKDELFNLNNEINRTTLTPALKQKKTKLERKIFAITKTLQEPRYTTAAIVNGQPVSITEMLTTREIYPDAPGDIDSVLIAIREEHDAVDMVLGMIGDGSTDVTGLVQTLLGFKDMQHILSKDSMMYNDATGAPEPSIYELMLGYSVPDGTKQINLEDGRTTTTLAMALRREANKIDNSINQDGAVTTRLQDRLDSITDIHDPLGLDPRNVPGFETAADGSEGAIGRPGSTKPLGPKSYVVDNSQLTKDVLLNTRLNDYDFDVDGNINLGNRMAGMGAVQGPDLKSGAFFSNSIGEEIQRLTKTGIKELGLTKPVYIYTAQEVLGSDGSVVPPVNSLNLPDFLQDVRRQANRDVQNTTADLFDIDQGRAAEKLLTQIRTQLLVISDPNTSTVGTYVGGKGLEADFIIVDGTANLAEQVYTVGHEIGHAFLEQEKASKGFNKIRARLNKSFIKDRDSWNKPNNPYEGKNGFEEWYSDQVSKWIYTVSSQTTARYNRDAFTGSPEIQAQKAVIIRAMNEAEFTVKKLQEEARQAQTSGLHDAQVLTFELQKAINDAKKLAITAANEFNKLEAETADKYRKSYTYQDEDGNTVKAGATRKAFLEHLDLVEIRRKRQGKPKNQTEAYFARLARKFRSFFNKMNAQMRRRFGGDVKTDFRTYMEEVLMTNRQRAQGGGTQKPDRGRAPPRSFFDKRSKTQAEQASILSFEDDAVYVVSPFGFGLEGQPIGGKVAAVSRQELNDAYDAHRKSTNVDVSPTKTSGNDARFAGAVIKEMNSAGKDRYESTKEAFAEEELAAGISNTRDDLAKYILKHAKDSIANDWHTLEMLARTTDAMVRRHSPEIADMMQIRSQEKAGLGFIKASTKQKNKWLTKLYKDVGDLSTPEVEAGLTEAFTDTPTANLKRPEAVKVRKYLESFYKDYISKVGHGFSVPYQENYSPVVLDLNNIARNSDHFMQTILSERAKQGVELNYVQVARTIDRILKYQDAVVNETGNIENTDWTDPASKAEEARTLTAGIDPSVLVAPDGTSYTLDNKSALVIYLAKMIKRGEWKRHTMSEDGETNLFQQELAKIEEKDPRAHRETIDIVKAHLGYTSSTMKPIKANILGKERTLFDPKVVNTYAQVFQFVTILPFATLSSIPDLAGPLINSKDFASASAGLKNILSEFKADPGTTAADMQKLAEDLGLVSNDAIVNAFVSQSEADFMTQRGRKITEFTFMLNGLTKFTNFSRIFASGMGVQFIIRQSEIADDPNHGKSKVAARYLDQLGLDSATVKAWLKNDRDLTTPEGQRVDEAVSRFVESSIMRPDSAQRPLWASDPRFAIIWQLKSFFYAYASTIMGGVYREMQTRQKEGATPIEKYGLVGSTAALLALTTLPLAAFGLELREYGKTGLAYMYQGLGESPKYKNGNWRYFRTDRMDYPEYMWELVQRSGWLGPAQLLVDARKADDWGNLGVIDPAASLLGPTVSFAKDVAEDTYKGNFDKVIKRSIPFTGIPLI